MTPPPHPDLFHQVPQEYHDYLDVFSEEGANTLPPHWEYDMKIKLEEGKKPPWGKIDGHSAVELAAMDEYLKTNLANGFIRPSESPAAAPVMFVKKPDGGLR